MDWRLFLLILNLPLISLWGGRMIVVPYHYLFPPFLSSVRSSIVLSGSNGKFDMSS